MKNILNTIKLEAMSLELPIILDDMEVFLHNLIRQSQPKTVLEIGSANGFSASVMLSTSKFLKLTTIEKDTARFTLAKKNLKHFWPRAKVINDDALNVLKALTANHKQFDLIFMDGPKAQYITYLPYILELLSKNGVLVCDNIFFHGMVNGTTPVSKGIKTMIAKLQEFLIKVTSLEGYLCQIINMADGVLVLKKQK